MRRAVHQHRRRSSMWSRPRSAPAGVLLRDDEPDPEPAQPGRPLLGGRRARADAAARARRSSPGMRSPDDEQVVARDVVERQEPADRVEHLAVVVPGAADSCSAAAPGRRRAPGVMGTLYDGARGVLVLREVRGGQSAGDAERGVRHQRNRQEHEHERAAAAARGGHPSIRVSRRPSRDGATPTAQRESSREPSRKRPAPGTWPTSQPIGAGRARWDGDTKPTAQHHTNARTSRGPKAPASDAPRGRHADDARRARPSRDSGARGRDHLAVPDPTQCQGREGRGHRTFAVQREHLTPVALVTAFRACSSPATTQGAFAATTSPTGARHLPGSP